MAILLVYGAGRHLHDIWGSILPVMLMLSYDCTMELFGNNERCVLVSGSCFNIDDEIPCWNYNNDQDCPAPRCRWQGVFCEHDPSTQPPSHTPTQPPSNTDSKAPSMSFPTSTPTNPPSPTPSSSPVPSPSTSPSSSPTAIPSMSTPTHIPSSFPSPEAREPSVSPSRFPTQTPSTNPTHSPSSRPSPYPSVPPTEFPTAIPSKTPSNHPTHIPTLVPSHAPTMAPTSNPTSLPSFSPMAAPSSTPTYAPTISPTAFPTSTPTLLPSSSPTQTPSGLPSSMPSLQPSVFPSHSPVTSIPSHRPTSMPTPIFAEVQCNRRVHVPVSPDGSFEPLMLNVLSFSSNVRINLRTCETDHRLDPDMCFYDEYINSPQTYPTSGSQALCGYKSDGSHSTAENVSYIVAPGSHPIQIGLLNQLHTSHEAIIVLVVTCLPTSQPVTSFANNMSSRHICLGNRSRISAMLSRAPTAVPSRRITLSPSMHPTAAPSAVPTRGPTSSPSLSTRWMCPCNSSDGSPLPKLPCTATIRNECTPFLYHASIFSENENPFPTQLYMIYRIVGAELVDGHNVPIFQMSLHVDAQCTSDKVQINFGNGFTTSLSVQSNTMINTCANLYHVLSPTSGSTVLSFWFKLSDICIPNDPFGGNQGCPTTSSLQTSTPQYVTSTLLSTLSCAERGCGLSAFNYLLACQCDSTCLLFDDCCLDYQSHCVDTTAAMPTSTSSTKTLKVTLPSTHTTTTTGTTSTVSTVSSTLTETSSTTSTQSTSSTVLYSCLGHCGSKNFVGSGSSKCFCDSLCTLADDCCEDYESVCISTTTTTAADSTTTSTFTSSSNTKSSTATSRTTSTSTSKFGNYSSCREKMNNCRFCNEDFSQCTKCMNKKYLLNGVCVDSCPPTKYDEVGIGTYSRICKIRAISTPSPPPGVCIEHENNCRFCSPSASACTKCKNSKYLYVGACTNTCPPGTVGIGSGKFSRFCKATDNDRAKCIEHLNNCRFCNEEATACTKCKNSKYLFQGNCIDVCPTNTIPIGNGKFSRICRE